MCIRDSPDTESYIWFLRNNVVRTTGLDFPLPEGDVEQQARMMFSQLAKVGADVYKRQRRAGAFPGGAIHMELRPP